ELADTMRRCSSEAAAAFGDGRVFAERLLPRARHIEVQVVGDGTGAVAVLGDRACSLQRRRQKLIEIGPAALSGAVRGGLAAAPAHGRGPAQVRVQARVKAEPLRPDGTLLPGERTLSRFQPPAGRGVRIDTAGYPGYTVSPRYDSLLAKVITTGGTLEEAARRAVRALAEFDIAGVPVNTGLLQAMLQAPGLGTHDVGWVDAHAAELSGDDAEEPPDEELPGDNAGELPGGEAAVRAPLTGTVVAVAVAAGDPVAAGDELPG